MKNSLSANFTNEVYDNLNTTIISNRKNKYKIKITGLSAMIMNQIYL